MPTNPRVLHLNDCAFVGANLVRAARAQGLQWRLLPPELTWPPVRPGQSRPTRFETYRTLARIGVAAARADVIHVHYATTVARIAPRYIPTRPYALHLHGTDIRTLWHQPERHARLQSYIDGAAHVYYSTPDNAEDATTARPDAEYLPVVFDPSSLPSWDPQGYVAFASRWEEVKGLEGMLQVASRLIAAGVPVRGLDWGPGAGDAARLGVELIPKAPHPDYLQFLANASVVVGQATRILSVSELEAMAIGAPLAAVGDHYPGPDGRPLPIRNGDVDAVFSAIMDDLADPESAARELGSQRWTLENHTAPGQIAGIQETYRRISR
ncbi:hypothetical protein [Microbacterium phyllosphaerae]|uniref:hypothetical protein n=1 Tax=Microbacterium phyllosphaerae TaxID=124798 RepID=UPI002168D525|nr:hypothetical protein [Microbacterium phyllosphaerae]MCS3441755.1 glycosyltransferase involved in cell wall biosynthesis [Microbacterium phyllosphaerae]